MTQTPPSSPAQGIAVAPTLVANGATSTIPFPGAAEGAPTPWTTPWVVLLNSSPYTLVVATGSTTTQIAAFTSDKVYVFAAGLTLPVTVTPQAGAMPVNPGSDSTVYATWYHDEPPGTYPAALGSGAVSNGLASLAFTQGTNPLANLGVNTYGPFSAQGYGSVMLQITTDAVLLVQVIWQDTAGVITIGGKQMIVPASGVLNVSIPHRGQVFSVRVTNQSGGTANWSGSAYQSQIPLQAWNFNTPVLIDQANPGVGAGLTVTLGSSIPVYAGPATWWYWFNNMTTGDISIEYQTYTGGWIGLYTVFETAAVPAGVESGISRLIHLPAAPIRIRAHNTTAGTVNPISSLVADDWRTAA